jgi:hypothetical protein
LQNVTWNWQKQICLKEIAEVLTKLAKFEEVYSLAKESIMFVKNLDIYDSKETKLMNIINALIKRELFKNAIKIINSNYFTLDSFFKVYALLQISSLLAKNNKTEEAYNAHRAKIEKGIADARARMEVIKKMFSAGMDTDPDKTKLFSIDELKTQLADFEREMREANPNEDINEVIKKLKGQSEIISKNRNRPGKLVSGEDVIFDISKRLDENLAKAEASLKAEWGDAAPEGARKSAIRAAFRQTASDLQYAYMEQLALFQKQVTEVTPEVARNLAIADENAETD